MKLSVVIPAYNESRYISAGLQSLLPQLQPGDEVIVVDNNSTDNTAEIAASLGARVIHESQRGVCAARQAGTLIASGDIIISTDADTIFPATWLKNIRVAFQQHPNAVAVAGTVEYRGGPWWAKIYAGILFGINQAVYRRTGQPKYITACNTAFRKSAWSGYNTQLTQGGDEFGLLKQLSERGRIIFLRDLVVRTSSRRLGKGLAYNLFITIGWYYLFDYLVGRLLGRSLLGSYAPIRHEPQKKHPVMAALGAIMGLAIALITVSAIAHPVKAARTLRRTGVEVGTIVRHPVIATAAIRKTGVRLESWTDRLGHRDRQ